MAFGPISTNVYNCMCACGVVKGPLCKSDIRVVDMLLYKHG